MLADMGADVIKVEPIEGEPWRLALQFIPGESKTYMSLNRGKRSLPLDLTSPDAMSVIRRMIPDVDVVVVERAAGRSGEAGDRLRDALRHQPAHHLLRQHGFRAERAGQLPAGLRPEIQAMSGLMAAEGKIKDGVPQQVSSTAVADFATGIAIAWGVCAALFHRERSGKGQKIETTLAGDGVGRSDGQLHGDRLVRRRAQVGVSVHTGRDA